jgi:hypothetical protein
MRFGRTSYCRNLTLACGKEILHRPQIRSGNNQYVLVGLTFSAYGFNGGPSASGGMNEIIISVLLCRKLVEITEVVERVGNAGSCDVLLAS